MPSISEEVQAFLDRPISDADHDLIYHRFVEGEDTVGLDTYDLELDDFDAMLGDPPYLNLTVVEADWTYVSAALHGFMVCKYLGDLEEFSNNIRLEDPGVVSSTLRSQFRSLVRRFTALRAACTDPLDALSSSTLPSVANLVAFQNLLWTARRIEFVVQDITVLDTSGPSGLTVLLSERKWKIQKTQ